MGILSAQRRSVAGVSNSVGPSSLDSTSGQGEIDSHRSASKSLRRRGRVLIIEPQNDGGMWHYAFSLAKALDQANYDATLATVFPFEDLGDKGNVRIRPIGIDTPPSAWRPTRPLQRMASHLAKLHNLWRIMLEFRPDIVHLHNPLGKLDFLYYKLLKVHRARVIYTAHDAMPLDRSGNWFDWARCRAADTTFVHSERDVGTLVSNGVDTSKITVIPHGNYLHFCNDRELSRNDAKRLLGLPPESRAVLFFGTISPYKGLDLLIDAFSRLSENDSNIYLIIAGPPTEDFAPYQRKIRQQNLSDRIVKDLRYIPFAEFARYFSASDLVAFPYRQISQSGVLQLAYAYARPVVVTNVGGLAEAVAQDQTGLIAAASNPQEFSDAIREMLADPGKGALMGERGRLLAATKYSWTAIVKEIARVYQPEQQEQ